MTTDMELIGGEYEIVGEDDDDLFDSDVMGDLELVGRRRRRRGGSRPRTRVIKQRTKFNARQYPLGLGSVTIAAGATSTAVLTAQPQRIFRGQRLVLIASVVGALVTDVLVGVRSQLAGVGNQPVELYSATSTYVEQEWDTAQVGNIITVQLQNSLAGTAITVSGAVIGTSTD